MRIFFQKTSSLVMEINANLSLFKCLHIKIMFSHSSLLSLSFLIMIDYRITYSVHTCMHTMKWNRYWSKKRWFMNCRINSDRQFSDIRCNFFWKNLNRQSEKNVIIFIYKTTKRKNLYHYWTSKFQQSPTISIYRYNRSIFFILSIIIDCYVSNNNNNKKKFISIKFEGDFYYPTISLVSKYSYIVSSFVFHSWCHFMNENIIS